MTSYDESSGDESMDDKRSDDGLFKFPCLFPIKAIGLDDPEFTAHVIGIVTDHVGAVSTDDIVTRPSSQGKYLSVTVTFTAHSRAQLDSLYRALTASDKIQHVF